MKYLVSMFLSVVLIYGNTVWAGAEKEYQKALKKMTADGASVEAKINAGDKSFCDEKSRLNMSTCYRAYLTQREHITFANEYGVILKGAMAALAADMQAKKAGKATGQKSMDDATMMLYTLETVLNSRLEMKYQNTFCDADASICAVENKFLFILFPFVRESFETMFGLIEKDRAKQKGSAATEKWKTEKLDTLKGLYKAVFLAPELKGPAAAESNNIAKQKLGAKYPEALAKAAEILALHAKKFQLENPQMQSCLGWSDKILVDNVRESVRICYQKNTIPKQAVACVDKQMTFFVLKQVSRTPASERGATEKCISRKSK